MAIDPTIEDKHRDAVQMIRDTAALLRAQRGHYAVPLSEYANDEGRVADALRGLLQTLKHPDTKLSKYVLQGSKKSDRLREFGQTITGLHRLLTEWRWVFRTFKDGTLTSAWPLLPDDNITSAVVLDATAKLNRLYSEFPQQFKVVEVETARSYQPVTIHAARCSHTGKSGVAQHADEIVPGVLASLHEKYGPSAKDRRVLVVCHKDHVPFVQKWAQRGPEWSPEGAGDFKALDVISWGSIDGRNDWQTYDTVVLLSLFYRDDAVALNAYQAAHGALGSETLNAPPDAVTALRVSQIVVDAAQSVNRARCRNVVAIDEHGLGSCETTDLFVRLPRDHEQGQRVSGDQILAGLLKALPGAKVVDWTPEAAVKRTGRPPRYEGALIAYVQTLAPGDRAWAVDVRRTLGMSPRTWDNLVAQVERPGTALARAFDEAGVRYVIFPRGRSKMGALVRGQEVAKVDAVR